MTAGPTEDKTHHGHSHSHATHQHGHTHEHMTSPGSFKFRERLAEQSAKWVATMTTFFLLLFKFRSVVRNDWNVRSFTVGIGGPVGSGKTAVGLICISRYLTLI